ncbi:hypothetical protein FRC03_006430 [Tulasnella sp. 419]|nr:hypothetical protein FRC03_006430 [Tulasnella sp. 419]
MRSLLNFLLGASATSYWPVDSNQVNLQPSPQRAIMSANTQFELKSSDSSNAPVFSPRDMLSLPRPGVGVSNPDKEDLVIVPVSEHSFDKKKTTKTIYIAPLDSTDTPVEFPVVTGGEAFWLDDRTLAHVVGDQVYAVSLEYKTKPSSSLTTPKPPYLVGRFPSGTSPSNFKFTGTKKVHTTNAQEDVEHLLVFSAQVYDDYNLTAIKERDELWKNRDTDALVFDEVYVRHWDEYVGPKRPSLFSVKLGKNKDGNWELGDEYFAPLKGTKHHTPVEPFGGTDDFDVSATHIAYTTKDPSLGEPWHTRQNVYVVPLKGGIAPRHLTSGNHGATHSVVFSPKGDKVAFTEMIHDGYESDRARVVIYDLIKEVRFTLTENWDRSASELAFSKDGKEIYIVAEEHANTKIFVLPVPETPRNDDQFSSPETPKALITSHTSHGLRPLSSGQLVYTQSSLASPNNVFIYDRQKNESTPITRFAEKQLKDKKLDKGESFWFTGAEGKQVQGWVLYPPSGKPKDGKKLPCAFLIHGGPQGAWVDGWSTRWNANVFAQQGYIVIAINPSGSTGFGQEFTDAITEDWGGKPFVDLKHGWDYALKTFDIDPERAVAAGASWGGFAINWIQGHPEYGFNFKALVCHDGIFDTRYGGYATDELFFFNHDFGGAPWTKKGRELSEKQVFRFVDKMFNPRSLTTFLPDSIHRITLPSSQHLN